MPHAAPLPARTTPRLAQRKEKKHRRHKSRSNLAPAAASLPATVPSAAAPPDQFDVELVPAPALAPAADPAAAALWPFAPRDWLVLGIGAGAMLLLAAIVFVIVMIARS